MGPHQGNCNVLSQFDQDTAATKTEQEKASATAATKNGQEKASAKGTHSSTTRLLLASLTYTAPQRRSHVSPRISPHHPAEPPRLMLSSST